MKLRERDKKKATFAMMVFKNVYTKCFQVYILIFYAFHVNLRNLVAICIIIISCRSNCIELECHNYQTIKENL